MSNLSTNLRIIVVIIDKIHYLCAIKHQAKAFLLNPDDTQTDINHPISYPQKIPVNDTNGMIRCSFG